MADSDKSKKQSVKVSIMQREYTVACSDEEMDGLVEAAAYLDKQMSTISKGSQVLAIDRCAIMAGLNISHLYLELQKKAGSHESVDDRLQKLHDQVDQVVSSIQEVEN